MRSSLLAVSLLLLIAVISTTVSAAKSAYFIGCCIDSSSRALRYGPQKYGYTVDTCAAACAAQGYTLMAMQGLTWCSCDSDFYEATRYGLVDDRFERGMPNLVKCTRTKGGSWSNALHVLVDDTATSAAPIAVPLGAFLDQFDRDLPDAQSNEAVSYTLDTCMSACHSLSKPFFGLQRDWDSPIGKSVCYCGSTFGKWGLAPATYGSCLPAGSWACNAVYAIATDTSSSNTGVPALPVGSTSAAAASSSTSGSSSSGAGSIVDTSGEMRIEIVAAISVLSTICFMLIVYVFVLRGQVTEAEERKSVQEEVEAPRDMQPRAESMPPPPQGYASNQQWQQQQSFANGPPSAFSPAPVYGNVVGASPQFGQ